ncbi:MAG: hypothetical protein M0Z96_09020 [Actinomycetota bacterium]|nr:hypothetical protein [Actinomycetota bacterium]
MTTRYGDQPPTPNKRSTNKTVPLGMLGLLAIQFLLGMGVNLYVTLPSTGFVMAEMMYSGPLVMVHMILGMLLVVGAVFAIVAALAYGPWAIVCAFISLGGILVAGVGGVIFLMGGQSNGASFLMAVGFLIAVGGYVVELAKAN